MLTKLNKDVIFEIIGYLSKKEMLSVSSVSKDVYWLFIERRKKCFLEDLGISINGYDLVFHFTKGHNHLTLSMKSINNNFVKLSISDVKFVRNVNLSRFTIGALPSLFRPADNVKFKCNIVPTSHTAYIKITKYGKVIVMSGYKPWGVTVSFVFFGDPIYKCQLPLCLTFRRNRI